jgi:uncharacterized phiE125 gp8 family phage protein
VNVAWQRTVAALIDPITVEDAKSHLREVVNDEDGDIARRIRSATEQAENYLHRGLLTQSWTYAQDEFTDEMWLPRAAPLQSVTSVKYYDTSGVQQTLSASTYHVDTFSEPGRILLAPNQVWPSVQAGRALAVEVLYVVGWTSADNIPADILEAIYLRVGTRHAFREDVIAGSGITVASLPDGVEALLAQHRVWWREPVCV